MLFSYLALPRTNFGILRHKSHATVPAAHTPQQQQLFEAPYTKVLHRQHLGNASTIKCCVQMLQSRECEDGECCHSWRLRQQYVKQAHRLLPIGARTLQDPRNSAVQGPHKLELRTPARQKLSCLGSQPIVTRGKTIFVPWPPVAKGDPHFRVDLAKGCVPLATHNAMRMMASGALIFFPLIFFFSQFSHFCNWYNHCEFEYRNKIPHQVYCCSWYV